MNLNNSPWLHQLNYSRPVRTLSNDLVTEVAIIGAGIAGVMSSYFTLKNTDKTVVLIEGGKVAHGATGHNAGQIVFEFEREFSSLVAEYGLEMAADAEKLVRGAWILLEELYQDAQLVTPMSSFMGYDGFTNIERLIEELENNMLRSEAGIQVYSIYISEDAPRLDMIPKKYDGLYTLVPHTNVLSLLETLDTKYIAVATRKKGCVNAALLVEEISGYLLATFPKRFSLYEETHVSEVILEKDLALLKTAHNSITADSVVLCTNGFEKFSIVNNSGDDIDTSFHHMVRGKVGYMAGYLEDLVHPPTALSFYDQTAEDVSEIADPYDQKAYIYMTRRPYELEKNEKYNLVCVGGPDRSLDDTSTYIKESEYSEGAIGEISNFLHTTYKNSPKGPIPFTFKWHGLMGYTPTGMRVVGREPKNSVLLYNLGCNGVGILTSIYGAKRIGEILKGTLLSPSVFDPKSSYHKIKVFKKRGLEY